MGPVGCFGQIESIKRQSLVIKNSSNTGQLFSSCRHWGGVGNGNSGARHDNVGGIVGAVIGGDTKPSSISGCRNNGTISGGWMNVNTTVLGGIAGLAKNVNIENCESAGVLKNGNNLCVGAVGGFVAYAKKAVAISGNSSCTASFEMKKLSDNFFWGLAFGNVTENAAIDGASFGCSANIDGTDIELSETNFADYICNTASKVQPTVGNCTWSK